MGQAFENLGLPIEDGLIVTPQGTSRPTRSLELIESSHPIPDEAGLLASRRILQMAASLGEGDRLVVLLSGGGSSLLCSPGSDLTLSDKQTLTDQLLASGAAIDEINCVRKHLSSVKGGRLAASAYPAACETFAISDVVGDKPDVIASGPTVADPTTSLDAMDILQRFQIPLTDRVKDHLRDPTNETPKPGDETLSRSQFHLIASPEDALAAAQHRARDLGYEIINLGAEIEGEARDVAKDHAAHCLRHVRDGRPTVLLSSGELTVTKQFDNSCGGPNHEYALALALELQGARGIHAIACDTDGKDGSAEAAGALIGPDTLSLAHAKGLDASHALATHSSGDFFAALGTNVVSGPTDTNVNDFRALLICGDNE